MKKTLILTLCILLSTTLSFFAGYFVMSILSPVEKSDPTPKIEVNIPLSNVEAEDDNEQKPSSNAEVDTRQMEGESTEHFTVKLIDGSVKVLKSDGSVHSILPISITMLPELDKAELIKGVELSSLNELASFIEDYTS